MIARGFKSVIWVATVGAAALGCYMVSLKVATERAELTKVERQIVAVKQDIRSLQTELGTRGRLSQLEQWNAEVLALSAPSPDQFLQDELTLARFEQHVPTLDDRAAEVQLANAAPVPAPAPQLPVVQASAQAQPPAALSLQQASVSEAARPPLKTAALSAPAKAKAPSEAKTSPKKPETAAVAVEAKPKAEPSRASRLDEDLVTEIRSSGGGN
jgi:hypothetical protein